MKKLEMSDAERQHLEWNRSLTTDIDGNEILQGLTVAESAELLTSRRERGRDSGTRKRRIQLNTRVEAARLAAVRAEVEARDVIVKN
jgi:hypothetical protein